MTVCPSDGCREVFTSEVVKSDKGCLKEIQALTTLCPKASCPWTGPLNEFMVSMYDCNCLLMKMSSLYNSLYTSPMLPHACIYHGTI